MGLQCTETKEVINGLSYTMIDDCEDHLRKKHKMSLKDMALFKRSLYISTYKGDEESLKDLNRQADAGRLRKKYYPVSMISGYCGGRVLSCKEGIDNPAHRLHRKISHNTILMSATPRYYRMYYRNKPLILPVTGEGFYFNGFAKVRKQRKGTELCDTSDRLIYISPTDEELDFYLNSRVIGGSYTVYHTQYKGSNQVVIIPDVSVQGCVDLLLRPKPTVWHGWRCKPVMSGDEVVSASLVPRAVSRVTGGESLSHPRPSEDQYSTTVEDAWEKMTGSLLPDATTFIAGVHRNRHGWSDEKFVGQAGVGAQTRKASALINSAAYNSKGKFSYGWVSPAKNVHVYVHTPCLLNRGYGKDMQSGGAFSAFIHRGESPPQVSVYRSVGGKTKPINLTE